jgi:hypothetical protein
LIAYLIQTIIPANITSQEDYHIMSEQLERKEGAPPVVAAASSSLEIDQNQCMDNMMGIETETVSSSMDNTGTSTISVPKKKSGIFGASSNLVNSIVGAGIIGIPYALRQCGLVAGVFLLVLVAYLTGTCMCICVCVCV